MRLWTKRNIKEIDVAGKLEAMQKDIIEMKEGIGYIKGQFDTHIKLEAENKYARRIAALEKHVFVFWVFGPLILGAAALFINLKKLLS